MGLLHLIKKNTEFPWSSPKKTSKLNAKSEHITYLAEVLVTWRHFIRSEVAGYKL